MTADCGFPHQASRGPSVLQDLMLLMVVDLMLINVQYKSRITPGEYRILFPWVTASTSFVFIEEKNREGFMKKK